MEPACRRRLWEGGYALALVGAALLPLTAVTALSVDFAIWQARGATLQRAADAAALAAVPALPSPRSVESRARAVARANGVEHGVGGITVGAEPYGRSLVRVTVSDPALPRVFSLPFLDGLGMTRTAVGAWAEPVSLGSPRNYLGTGSLAGDSDPDRGLPGVPAEAPEGYWLAVNGPCASREQGDWLTAVSEGNVVSSNPPVGEGPWRGCTSAADPAVVMVRPDGPQPHLVALRVPDDYDGGPFTVELFDASYCTSSAIDSRRTLDPFVTTFQLLGPPLAIGSSGGSGSVGVTPPMAEEQFTFGTRCDDPQTVGQRGCGPSSWSMRWCPLGGVADPEPGATYLVAVSTGPVEPSARHGVNAYAVRVTNGLPGSATVFAPCSTDPQDPTIPYQPSTCIAVEGRDWLSVTTARAGRSATFALASVGAEHAGATMEVLLFDIGEGSSSLQLLDPSGSAVGFTWEVAMAPGDVPPSGGVRGVVARGGSLDVRGTGAGICGGSNPQRGPGRISGSKYNDRVVRLRVTLPDDPESAWGSRSWWGVRYLACEDRVPTDRTSWSVRVDGQPVRLVG